MELLIGDSLIGQFISGVGEGFWVLGFAVWIVWGGCSLSMTAVYLGFSGQPNHKLLVGLSGVLSERSESKDKKEVKRQRSRFTLKYQAG